MGGGMIMALFSFHCQNYKAGALFGLDKHNRRLNKNYGNPDINPERTHLNRIYVAPKKSLYTDCKEQIQKKVIEKGNRVRSDSNWICECIFTYPEGLDLKDLDKYNQLILRYLSARLGSENLIEAVCHLDEAETGRAHLHADFLVITAEGRLSSKALITREFITSIHDKLPLVLQHHGFDVERGTPGKVAGLNAKEYKKKMEKEKEELDKKLDHMVAEYNQLVDKYNQLAKTSQELNAHNYQKAKEICNEWEYNR